MRKDDGWEEESLSIIKKRRGKEARERNKSKNKKENTYRTTRYPREVKNILTDDGFRHLTTKRVIMFVNTWMNEWMNDD